MDAHAPHPRGPRPGKLGLLVAVVLLVAACGWWFTRGDSKPRASGGPAPVPVTVEQVSRRDVPHIIQGIGTVLSLHSVVVRAQVEGIFTELTVKEGQQVNPGDLLARIDDRAIAAEVAQAKAEKARNEALLHAARLDLERYANLVKDEAIASQMVDQQKAQVAQLEAIVRANEAAIAAAQVRLSFTRITSPVKGRVGLRRVDPGNLVRTSDAQGLFTVTQLDPIAVLFSLPQDDLPRLRALLKDPSGASVTAYDRAGGVALAEGRLTMIDNQVDPATGTIPLRAEFANPDGRLWPGQFVTVELKTGESPGATVVSARTVQRGLQGPFVFRVQDGKATVVPVTVGYADDELAVVASGVAPGDTVISDGHSRLKPGSAVKVVSGGDDGAVKGASR
ncbi:efflux RND transporter periplasmic adaptor subunit [Pyxidicoccus fallax]|uniref:Efflux RND transporter periplasmic adaptor subunit n=2 Tax=Pyxidicoccus fallax TaxID=394095 RepID=A0A848LA95_9BACT|nr:efflux RND transporter periplasmic adaptor subunit [Pyxidicoccus fallax]NMO15980.1 efflux RND transporter periplasmic adaptor subunit [Pyxidicoccus fallax]NPC77394.1 efflux RND transporter periplasmic adaptor subunit [Pyxidicoccus fallax]